MESARIEEASIPVPVKSKSQRGLFPALHLVHSILLLLLHVNEANDDFLDTSCEICAPKGGAGT